MKVCFKWTYKQAKKPSCTFQSEYIEAKEALIICEDLEKIGRGQQFEFMDERNTVWTKKELIKLLTEIKDEPQDVIVYFDGGFMKESSLAGLGMIVYYTQNDQRLRKRKNKRMEQLISSNEAEYAAFYEALCLLEVLEVHHQTCVFRGDSHVVLQQLAGEWPCYDDVFNAWLDRIEKKMTHLGIHPIYEPISRKENKEADTLASQAIEGTRIDSLLKLTSKGEE